MTSEQFEVLSNQAVAACGVVYFLAFLAQLVQWSANRKGAIVGDDDAVPATTSANAQESVDASADGVVATKTRTGDEDSPATRADERSRERADLFGRIGIALTIVAVGVHLLAVVTRGLAADPVRVPWSNMYEFTLTATSMVTLFYLLILKRFKLAWLAPVVTGFVWIVLLLAVRTLYQPIAPLRDALQSPWLVVHVVAANIATGAFTLAGMASVLYLIKARWPNTRPGGFIARMPSLSDLDRLAYRTTAFGFPVWTFGVLIAGPIWARDAWGRYWQWDPKEVWAFITWVAYAAYLHARATAGWKGRAAAIISLIALVTLWFNFIGINYFFGSSSLHSYA